MSGPIPTPGTGRGTSGPLNLLSRIFIKHVWSPHPHVPSLLLGPGATVMLVN